MVDDFAVTTEAIADDCCVVVVQGVVNLFTSAQVLGVLLQAIDAGHARLVRFEPTREAALAALSEAARNDP